jgi:hypothetical protein
MAEPEASPDPKPKGAGDGPQDPPRKLFTAFIAEQGEGRLHGELTDGLAQVVKRVLDLQKGGSITLKIDISPAGKAQGMVLVSDKVTLKLPEEKSPSLFFADDRGNVTRQNPHQTQLPVRSLAAAEAARDLPPRD